MTGVYDRILLDRKKMKGLWPQPAGPFFTSVAEFDAALIYQAWTEVTFNRPLRRMAANLARDLYRA